MPVNMQRRPVERQLQTVTFAKFDGGWNVRDSVSGLELGESPDMKNIVIDERGGIGSRLGIVKAHTDALPGVSTVATTQGYYWESANLIFLYLDQTSQGSTAQATPGGEFTFGGKTFTTNARIGMCEFNGELVAIHPVDGLWTYDGTTWTSRNTSVKGNALAVWQNKVWATGDSERVWWSNAGDSHTWTHASDFNDLQEVDTLPCTAIGVGQGMDVTGRPGLLVFKRRSVYRINDSETGAYTTLSSEAGAGGSNCVADIAGMTAFIGDAGIYVTDGVAPPVKVSDQIHPLFSPHSLSLATADLALWSAGVKDGDTFVFNVMRSGASAPDLTLEVYPKSGTQVEGEVQMPVVPHEGCAMRWLITIPTSSGTTLWGGGAAANYVYRVFEEGDDDGTAIDAYWTSRAFEANEDALWHLVRVRAKGRGEGVALSVIADWSTAAGSSYNLTDWVAEEGEWGSGTWGSGGAFGTGFWGAGAYELLHDVWNLGTAHAFAIRLAASTSAFTTKPPMLGFGTGNPLGAWNCYGIRVDLRTLGGA